MDTSNGISIKRKPFFSHKQLQRILTQLTVVFSGYRVQTGTQRDGKQHLRDVPVIYGDLDRVAGYIMGPRQQQENTTSYVPFISVNMEGLKQSNDMRQSPQYSEKNFIHRVRRDANNRILVDVPAERDIVETFMPVPYNLDLSVSIWASNNDEGFQLIEQLATAFNPDQEIQLSNSPTDWTFLTTLFFNGSFEFEKSYPAGTTTDPLYIYRSSFSVLIWLSLPAKVYGQKPIYEIDMSIQEMYNKLNLDTISIDNLKIKVTDEEKLVFENYDPQPIKAKP